MIVSDKKTILEELANQGYKRLTTFRPDYRLLKYFNNQEELFFSSLSPTPVTISVYKKDFETKVY